jgi:hypothetical protein
MAAYIYQNPNTDTIYEIATKYSFSQKIVDTILSNNKRVELQECDDFFLLISYIPEYVKESKAIRDVEIDICFDKRTQDIVIFAFGTKYFFSKYSKELSNIKYSTFDNFLIQVFEVITLDQSKIIEHILKDTEEIKNEYYAQSEAPKILRHLTNNQINISALKLILSNQEKFLDLLVNRISKGQQKQILFEKFNLMDGITYAEEFSRTLMESINTKYNVKESENMYRLESVMFLIFTAELAMKFTELIVDGGKHLIPFVVGVLMILATYIYVAKYRHND